jgi:hypothetical protein
MVSWIGALVVKMESFCSSVIKEMKTELEKYSTH